MMMIDSCKTVFIHGREADVGSSVQTPSKTVAIQSLSNMLIMCTGILFQLSLITRKIAPETYKPFKRITFGVFYIYIKLSHEMKQVA